MDLTEGDESYELGHLEGEWRNGKHRKLVGVLSQSDFDELVEDCEIAAQDVETMGCLGVPWGWHAPAISFRSEHDCAIVEAYVTPLPSFEIKNRQDDDEWQNRAWERIRDAVIKKYKW
jgi:hypothetical protein